MNPEEAIDRAVHSSEPVQALRSLAEQLLTEGHSTAEVLGLFERARERFRATGREADEDVLLDAMDFVTGWCSPHMKIDAVASPSRQGPKASGPKPERELSPARYEPNPDSIARGRSSGRERVGRTIEISGRVRSG